MPSLSAQLFVSLLRGFSCIPDELITSLEVVADDLPPLTRLAFLSDLQASELAQATILTEEAEALQQILDELVSLSHQHSTSHL